MSFRPETHRASGAVFDELETQQKCPPVGEVARQWGKGAADLFRRATLYTNDGRLSLSSENNLLLNNLKTKRRDLVLAGKGSAK